MFVKKFSQQKAQNEQKRIFKHRISVYSVFSVGSQNYSFAVSSEASFSSLSFISSFSFTLKCRSVLSATIFCSTLAQAAPLHVLSFSSMLTNCTSQYMAVSWLARWVFM